MPKTDVNDDDVFLPDDTLDESTESDEANEAIVADDTADVETPAEGGESEDEASDDNDESEADDADESAKKEQARKAYEERQAQKQQQEQSTAPEPPAQPNVDYIAQLTGELEQELSQIEDPMERRIAASEAREFLAGVRTARTGLIADNGRAQAEIDLFNPANPQFNQTAYDYAMREYSDAHLIYDQNGEIIGAKKSLYDHLKQTADVLGTVGQQFSKQGQQQERQMQHAVTPPPVTPKRDPTSKEDPFMQGFNSDD